MRGLRKAFVFLALAWGLSACAEGLTVVPGPTINAETPQKPRYQPIAYLGTPIKVPADRVQVIEHYRDFSNIQPTDFVVSPEQVARRWANQRLRATGGDGEVRFVIEKVGARSEMVDGIERITAVLEAHVVINRGNGGESGRAAVLVDSETTINGPVSPDERQIIYHKISRDMASKLDEKLTAAVRTKLASFLDPSERRVAVARPTPPEPVTARAPKDPVPAAPQPTAAPSPAPATEPPAIPARQAAAKPASPTPAAASPPVPKAATRAPERTSPLVDSDGRLPSSAWRRGWNWTK